MSILAIAKIQQNSKTVAYRLIDTFTKEIKNATIESVYADLRKSKSTIDNICLKNNIIHGRGWDIDRIPIVNDGKLINTGALTIVGRAYQYDSWGYHICTFIGEIDYMTEQVLLQYEEVCGITNGDAIEINGKKHIEYITDAEEFYKSKIDEINAKLAVLEQPYAIDYDWSIVVTNKELTHIGIINGIRYIKDQTFEACTRLRTIKFSKGLRHIGSAAFRNCENLMEIHIPDGVKGIGAYAFSGCVSLKEAFLPVTLESLGNDTLMQCRSLLALGIPPKIKVIPQEMCIECESLAYVVLNNGLERIGSLAFQGCKSLEKIELPDSVEYIGSYAFQGCKRLKSVRLPPRIKEVGNMPFKECTALKEIILPREFFFKSEGLLSNIGTTKMRLY